MTGHCTSSIPFARRACALTLALLTTCSWGCQDQQSARAQAATVPESSPEASPERAPSVVFLGDSLTAGLGLPEREAWPALIQERLDQEKRAYRVVNAGRSGDTTAGGLARVDWYLRDEVDLRALVIALGSNDGMRGLPLDAMEENLRQLIQKTRARKPRAKIFLWQLETFPNMGKEYATAYRSVFPRVAESEKVILIPFPLEEVAGHPELNQEDGIHPNALGTRKVAERIWAALTPHL